MPKRTKDWLKQAERDLRHARNSLKLRDYEWTCFAAQQSAEKAVKALSDFLCGEGWGHSVTKLLKELPLKLNRELIKKGAYLDKMYIPARYPNGFFSEAPVDYFTDKEAKEAISYATDILTFIKTKISQ